MALIQFQFYGNYKPLTIFTTVAGKTAQWARDSLLEAPEDLRQLTEEFLEYLFRKGEPYESATISHKGYCISWVSIGQEYEPAIDFGAPELPGLDYAYAYAETSR